MNLTQTIRRILREEYKLPTFVRRIIDFSNDNIVLLLRDMILRRDEGDKVATLVNAISKVAEGMFWDAGLHDTEYNDKNIYKFLVNHIENKFGDYIKNYYDEVYNGDDNEIYIFYKHADRYGGNGFTKGITGWYEFLHQYGYWFPMIDWPEVREKLKSIPRGQKLLLSSPGDSNNTMGYYFSISIK